MAQPKKKCILIKYKKLVSGGIRTSNLWDSIKTSESSALDHSLWPNGDIFQKCFLVDSKTKILRRY